MQMKKKDFVAQQIVKEIIEDISDRHRLCATWDSIPDDTQKQIILLWENIVKAHLESNY